MNTEGVPRLDFGQCDDAPEWGDDLHRKQVRYSIKRVNRIEFGKVKPYWVIVDNEKDELPEWAYGLFPMRLYAVARLQKYLLGCLPKVRWQLEKELENSPLTFTLRKKSELRYP
jgi:hypothetical protein